MAEDKLKQADIDKAVKAAIAEAKSEWDAEKEAEIQGLKNKNKELLGKVRDASGVKPEDLAAVEAERDQLAADLADANKQVKALTGERDKAVKALEAESGFTNKLLVGDGIKTALIANGVKDEDFIDTLSAKFGSSAKVDIDGDNRVAKIGDKPVADFIKEWAATDQGKKFVSAPINGGGGASGGKGGGGDAKQITRDQFDAMDAAAKMAFSKDGGQVVDA